MKFKLLKVVFTALTLSVSSLANAGLIVDQVNDSQRTVGFCNSGCAWMQEVIVGTDGTLDGLSVNFDSQGTFDIFFNIGSIYDRNTPDYSINNLNSVAGWTEINTSSLNLNFNTGNTFTFGIVNSTSGFGGTRNLYAGDLYLSYAAGVTPYNFSSYDLQFKTVMDTSEVPEPSTLAFFAFVLIGLASRQIKKYS